MSTLNLKSLLKAFKLNESTISVILGIMVIVVVGVLMANYFKGLRQAETLPSVTTEADETTIMRDGKTYHLVQKGDTLWSVAEKYYDSGYNWTDIAETNHLTNANIIETGQELEIPNVEAKKATVMIDTGSNTSVKTDVYTVVHGDNLWSIAQAHYGDGNRWTEIAQANHLVNPRVIHAGNQLILP